MEQKQKDALWAQYSKQTHVLGRVLSILTVALLLGAPFVIGGLLGAYPDLGATAACDENVSAVTSAPV